MAVRREAAVRNARGGARAAGQGLSRNVLSNAWKRASGVTHTRTAAKKPNGKEKCRTQRRICGKGKTCGECHALADFKMLCLILGRHSFHEHLEPLGCEQRKRVGLLSGDEATTNIVLYPNCTCATRR